MYLFMSVSGSNCAISHEKKSAGGVDDTYIKNKDKYNN